MHLVLSLPFSPLPPHLLAPEMSISWSRFQNALAGVRTRKIKATTSWSFFFYTNTYTKLLDSFFLSAPSLAWKTLESEKKQNTKGRTKSRPGELLTEKKKMKCVLSTWARMHRCKLAQRLPSLFLSFPSTSLASLPYPLFGVIFHPSLL